MSGIQSQPFMPHSFDTKIQVSGVPNIYISADAYNDMLILVDEVAKEVSWLGTAGVTENGYLIEEVFLVKQEVGHTVTDMDEDGIASLGMELMAQPDGDEKVNKLRFWGHSHVDMSTSPSSQDNSQMDLFKDNGCDWFIRGIANKKGKIEFAFYDFTKSIIYNDVPWSLHYEIDDGRREKWVKEIDEKVEEIAIVSYAKGFGYGVSGYGANSYYSQYFNNKKRKKGKGVIENEWTW